VPKVKVNDFTMHYLDQGKGEALVLLHGLGGNCHEWDLQMKAFTSHYRVIAPDLRGHGLSEMPTTPTYTPFDHASDVIALLDSLGVDKAWVLGLSAGGFATLALAVLHPERLKGIILASTAPYVDEDTHNVGERWVEILQNEGLHAYLARLVKDLFTLDFFLKHPEEVQDFINSQKHRNLAGIAPSAKANNSFDVRGELSRIKLPALIIHGLNDRVVNPAHARRMRQALAGSEVKLLTGAGHIVNVERAREFNTAVLDFLARRGTRHVSN
jgi:pimeloyl-ACP methyl ester carboxylesterase